MEARIKEREDSQINNTIAAPLLNITEEQLSLSVEDIGVSVIKEWDATWISCDSLHAWLWTQSRLIAMVSSLLEFTSYLYQKCTFSV